MRGLSHARLAYHWKALIAALVVGLLGVPGPAAAQATCPECSDASFQLGIQTLRRNNGDMRLVGQALEHFDRHLARYPRNFQAQWLSIVGLAQLRAAAGQDSPLRVSLAGQPVDIVTYEGYMIPLFKPGSEGAAERRRWNGRSVAVAVRYNQCGEINGGLRTGYAETRWNDSSYGARSFRRPSAMIGTRTMVFGESRGMMRQAVDACRDWVDDNIGYPNFLNESPGYVVLGQMHCQNPDCGDAGEREPNFIIDYVFFTRNKASAWPSAFDYFMEVRKFVNIGRSLGFQ